MERLIEIIPTLEKRTKGQDHDDTDPYVDEGGVDNPTQWGQGLKKSQVLPLVTERVKEDLIATGIKKLNAKLAEDYKNAETNEKKVNGHILNCKEMSDMLYSRKEPRIKYTFRSVSGTKGELRVTPKSTILIRIKDFMRITQPTSQASKKLKQSYTYLARKGDRQYFDKNFEHAKNEVLSLIKMQGWYGVPRLYGLCMTSPSGGDVTELLMSSEAEKTPKWKKRASSLR